jgi:hypothetical protein
MTPIISICATKAEGREQKTGKQEFKFFTTSPFLRHEPDSLLCVSFVLLYLLVRAEPVIG